MELLKNVDVNKKYFTLSDIAIVNTSNKTLENRLRKMIVGYSPVLGYKKIIQQEKIESVVKAHTQDIREKITWSGADKITISSIGKYYSVNNLVYIAEAHLQKKLNTQFKNVTVEYSGDDRAYLLPEGKVLFEARFTPKWPLKRICVWVDVYIDDEFYTSKPLWFNVKAYKEVVVANEAINSNSTAKNKVRVELKDVAELNAMPVEVDTDNNYWVVKPVRRGEILTTAVSARQPDVVLGNTIFIDVSYGAVRLSTKGIAKSSGNKGHKVKVKNIRSGEIYVALVSGKNRAILTGE